MSRLMLSAAYCDQSSKGQLHVTKNHSLKLESLMPGKVLRYNFSFDNSLLKRLWNSSKVNESSLTKIITSFTSFCEFFN